MPREHKKRGRRGQAAERRRAEEEGSDDADGFEAVLGASPVKRRRTTKGDFEESTYQNHDTTVDAGLEEDHAAAAAAADFDDRPFYGLLDDQEQEYFKRADGMLEVNQFSNAEERQLFLENVYKEAEAKELKLACSQSCSRLLERLILLSSPSQLKHLFQQFTGHFLNLVQHRFASHCCETLFIQSAPVVTQELLDPASSQDDPLAPGATAIPPMETFFLQAIEELSGNLGYLMTDTFASHTLRILLIILSGQPLDASSRKSLLKSRKKEHIDVIGSTRTKKLALDARTVPETFIAALEKMMNSSIAGLEPHYLRTLATHPIGNPVIQLLVQLELTKFGKQRAKDEKSIIRRLLPQEQMSEGTESANFVNGLLYDSIGSRLLETIIVNAPGKMFKSMYRELFRDRMGSLAHNEVAAYVAGKVIERLSADDLQKAHDAILPQVPGLALRGRTGIIRTLVERCAARGLDTGQIRDMILSCWSNDDGQGLSIPAMLEVPAKLEPVHTTQSKASRKRHNSDTSSEAVKPAKLLSSFSAPSQPISTVIIHRSLLAQTMLSTPGPLSEMIFAAISALDSAVCLHIANTSSLSPVLQQSLTVPHASLIFRRKLITRFYSHIGELALDSSGSHLVDAIWSGTLGMAFARERVAEELAENEASLRNSSSGRKVWRNWKMDLYKRRRAEWVQMIRGEVGNEGFQSFPDGLIESESAQSSRYSSSRASTFTRSSGRLRGSPCDKGSNGNAARPKTKLDLARERHALKKASNNNASKVARKQKM